MNNPARAWKRKRAVSGIAFFSKNDVAFTVDLWQ
jgi:hypothetical protein